MLPTATRELLLPPDDQCLLLPGGNNDLGIANLYPDRDKHVRGFFPVMDARPASTPASRFNMQLALRAAGTGSAASRMGHRGRRRLKRELKRYRRSATPARREPSRPCRCDALLKPDAPADPAVQALKRQGGDHRGQQRRHLRPALHAVLARREVRADGGRRDPRQHRRDHPFGALPAPLSRRRRSWRTSRLVVAGSPRGSSCASASAAAPH